MAWYSERKILRLRKPHISVYFELRQCMFGIQYYPHFVDIRLGIFGIILAWKVVYKGVTQ